MKRKNTISGYQVRNKHNDGIRFHSSYLDDCLRNCPFGCAVWSTSKRAYGIKIRLFWMAPFRKIGYDKYSNVVNFFHFHVGWEILKGDVPIEIVYDPAAETIRKE